MTHPLPDLYARWMAEALPAPPSGERHATCSDCAMCTKPDGTVAATLYVFRPDVKCCVYQPRLSNFLVGRTLLSEDGPGRRSVQARIDAGVGVTPLALERPPAYDLPFRHTVNAIGRSATLRCPHFVEEGGLCGIWRNRDAQCSTWFCKHERGPIGEVFWGSLRDLLTAVEAALARWAAREEGVPAEVIASFLPRTEHDHTPALPPDGPALDGRPDPHAHRALWGDWAGHEAEFYVACAKRVDALSWADVERIGGVEVSVRADLARQRHATHVDRVLPERLVVGQFQIVTRRPGGVRATTYSSLDAIDLPDALLGMLPLFDGRPHAEVLAQIRATWSIEFDEAYLRRLVDWGVLTAA